MMQLAYFADATMAEDFHLDMQENLTFLQLDDNSSRGTTSSQDH
jgi:hypothetical protein